MSQTALVHPYWERNEFIAFLLLHAANADMEFTDEERQLIRKTLSGESLQAVEYEYNQLTDYQRIQVIQSYRTRYFADDGQKAGLLLKIREVFQADGKYDIMEHSLFLMLQKIL